MNIVYIYLHSELALTACTPVSQSFNITWRKLGTPTQQAMEN